MKYKIIEIHVNTDLMAKLDKAISEVLADTQTPEALVALVGVTVAIARNLKAPITYFNKLISTFYAARVINNIMMFPSTVRIIPAEMETAK